MKPILIASAAIVATTAAAFAHSGATGVVKERMDQMKAVAASMKAIGGMIKGAVPYDAATVEIEAAKIAKHGGEALTRLFPEGTTKHPSEARAEIWTDWDRFSTIADDLARYAAALSKGAGNDRSVSAGGADLAAMSPYDLFMKVAGTCSACHEDFRQKKE